MKQLTVVIPAYNAEVFLKRCMDSLLQTEYIKDTELIIVNDGSKDGTGEIANQYQKEYPDIVRAVHKENGGHGSAINAGMKHATGKYFKVIDSDDWVDKENYNHFLWKIKQLDCDLIATPFTCIFQKNGNTVRELRRCIEGCDTIETGKILNFKDYADNLHVRMHEWTIRTEILKKNALALAEHSFYVDMQYILFPVPWIEKFCILDIPVYCYRLGNEGQSVAVKNMQKNRTQHQNVQKSLVEYYKLREAVGDEAVLLAYIANGIAKMQADEVQIILSLPIGKKAKAELISQEQYLKKECPNAYKANQNIGVKLLRWSGYLLYTVAAVMWRLTRR